MFILNGILIVDKPPGLTSARAVGRVKRLLARGTKIGHAGTLDPFATGVLLMLVGRATKLCETIMDQPKQYEATLMFGATTATDDPESPQIAWTSTPAPIPPVGIEQIHHTLRKFQGQILQTPPVFSAMKVNGQRAYDLARRGTPPVMVPRQVTIYGIEIVDYTWPLLKLKIDCGRGTYIRALARDIGADLDVGGHLVQLRRTRIGPYSIDSAVGLDNLSLDTLKTHFQPLDAIQ